MRRLSQAGAKAAGTARALRRRRGETAFEGLERLNAALGPVARGSARGDFTPAEILDRIRARRSPPGSG